LQEKSGQKLFVKVSNFGTVAAQVVDYLGAMFGTLMICNAIRARSAQI
jgi:hypothetical protein